MRYCKLILSVFLLWLLQGCGSDTETTQENTVTRQESAVTRQEIEQNRSDLIDNCDYYIERNFNIISKRMGDINCSHLSIYAGYLAYYKPELSQKMLYSDEVIDSVISANEDFDKRMKNFLDLTENVSSMIKDIGSLRNLLSPDNVDNHVLFASMGLTATITTNMVISSLNASLDSPLIKQEVNEAIRSGILSAIRSPDCITRGWGDKSCLDAFHNALVYHIKLKKGFELTNYELDDLEVVVAAFKLAVTSIELKEKLTDLKDVDSKLMGSSRNWGAASATINVGIDAIALKLEMMEANGQDLTEMYQWYQGVGQTLKNLNNAAQCVKAGEVEIRLASCIEAASGTVYQYMKNIADIFSLYTNVSGVSLSEATASHITNMVLSYALEEFVASGGRDQILADKYAINNGFDYEKFLVAVTNDLGYNKSDLYFDKLLSEFNYYAYNIFIAFKDGMPSWDYGFNIMPGSEPLYVYDNGAYFSIGYEASEYIYISFDDSDLFRMECDVPEEYSGYNIGSHFYSSGNSGSLLGFYGYFISDLLNYHYMVCKVYTPLNQLIARRKIQLLGVEHSQGGGTSGAGSCEGVGSGGQP